MDNSQKKKLTSAAIIVMSSIILSRVTGYLRVVFISKKIGVNAVSDAYFTAFILPDLMFNLLVGGAISAALIPVLSGYIGRKQEKDGWEAVGSFINTIFIAIIVLCILGIIFTPQIIPVIASGFAKKSMETQMMAIKLTRILFPSVSFLMLAGICNGILNSYQRFAAAAYGPAIYNVGCALSIFVFGNTSGHGVERVAYGILASAAIYFLFQLAFTIKHLKYYRFGIDFKSKGYRLLFKLSIPSLLASSVVQLNVMVSASYVTLFRDGSFAAFKFADTTWQMPYGIFAQGIGIAILPTLSAKLATGDKKGFKDILDKSMKAVLLPAIPSAVALIVLREPIVRAIFKWGSTFQNSQISMTGNILMLFSLALVTQSIVNILNRAFYADNNVKIPLLVGVSTIIMNYCLGFLFLKTTRLEAGGMALSYSIISFINAAVLTVILNKKMNAIDIKSMLKFMLKVTAASIFMGIVLFALERLPVKLNMKYTQLLYLMLEIAAGSAAFFICAVILKVEEAGYVLKKARNILLNFTRKM